MSIKYLFFTETTAITRLG